MNKPIVNTAASIHQRLLNLAREHQEDFGLVLTKYGLQRVLYRISQSKHRNAFILKGALLFELWTEQRYRPTRDVDFLVRGENNPERYAEIFREICEMQVDDDGLRFDASAITAQRITEDADYEGIGSSSQVTWRTPESQFKSIWVLTTSLPPPPSRLNSRLCSTFPKQSC